MRTLILNNGKCFEIDFAAPASITENILFIAKVLNSTPDEVHNAFKKPSNTSVLTLSSDEESPDYVGATYTGYTNYVGFTVEFDGSILVRLKKNVG